MWVRDSRERLQRNRESKVESGEAERARATWENEGGII